MAELVMNPFQIQSLLIIFCLAALVPFDFNVSIFFFSFFCRVVGGFEALTAMENVESDPKTDKPKVRINDVYGLVCLNPLLGK